jgi:hypothetical protein
MATFPKDVGFVIAGAGENEGPIAERSDMERGVAKVRRIATDPVVTLSGTLLFRSSAILADFKSWFYSAAGANAGAGWFDWTHPRTGALLQARFVVGSFGPITPVAGRFVVATRPAAIEYVERL